MVREALKSLAPQEPISVSNWAAENRVMGDEESPTTGPWSNELTPYLTKIMDAMGDDYTEEIVLLKAAQIGFTEALLNYVGYCIDRDPSRFLYVLPEKETASEFSEDRMQKFLRSCAVLDHKIDLTNSKDLMLRFRGGFIKIASAQTPSKLASWPLPRVIMDEVDKYPRWTGREASPLKLARERTKNWPKRKIIIGSTPTLKDGHVYEAWKAADARYKYYVPCPYCGELKPLEWPNVRFDKDADLTAIEYTAYYECPCCHNHITDEQKPEMLRKGKWVAINTTSKKPKKIAFHINSLYSPWITFGQMAKEFITSKSKPQDLMNFVNSWLGEFWESKSSKLDTNLVMNRKTNLSEGIIPSWAKILTGAVDVQKGYFYWSIRAWGVGIKSQGIANGKARDWESIANIMDVFWPIEGSKQTMQVSLYGVDAGYNEDETYQFCIEHDAAVPVRGSPVQMVTSYRISQVTKPLKGTGLKPLLLYTIDTDQYKNAIAARLAKPLGSVGSWMVNKDIDAEYADSMISEEKVFAQKNGRMIETWVPKSSHPNNHLWDTEVYSFCMADLMNVRYLTEDELTAPEPQEKLKDEKEKEEPFSLPDYELPDY